MTDVSLGTLGFSADTTALLGVDAVLQKLAKTSAVTEAAIAKMVATNAAAFAKMPPSFAAAVSGGGASGASSATAAQVAAQGSLAGAVGHTNLALAAQAAVLGSAAKAHQSHGAAAQANSLAMLEVAHVGRAMFDSLAAGGNVFRSLAMESGRLQVALTQGDLSGALSGIATKALGLVNPVVLSIGAVTGLGAAALLASSHVRSLDQEMNRAVGGAGRFAGVSAQGLSELASAGTVNLSQTGLGLSDARSAVMAFSRTGRLDPSNISGATSLVPGYAGLTGSTFDQAGTKLAGLLADPVHGMSELEKAVGALDDRTREAVRSLNAQGDAQAAVRVLIDATSVALNEQVKPQGPLDRFFTALKNRNAEIEAGIASAVAGPTPQRQYLDASRIGGSPGLLGVLQSRGAYDDGTGNLAEDFRHSAMLRGGSPIMRSEAADLLGNQQSQSAADIIHQVLPELTGRQRLTDQQGALSKALSNPDVLQKLGPSAADAFDALDRLTTGLATFKTSLQRTLEESQFSVASRLARTATERAAIDSQRDYSEALERTHSRLEAATLAEAKRDEAIADSTRTALDALRATSDRAALVGLRPYDRIMQESQQRFRDMNERVITGPVTLGTAITAGQGTLGSAVSGPGTATPAMIADAATRTGLSPALIAALGAHENGGRLGGGTNILDANGKPASSAYGFGQITSGAEADIRKVIPGYDRTNPDTEVLGAATYLKQLLDRNHGNVTAALGAYEGPDPAHNGQGNGAAVADILRRAGGGSASAQVTGAVGGPVDINAATLANRVNFAVGRQADVSNLLMQGPQSAADRLSGQMAALKAQQSILGQSSALIAAAAEKQREWNEVTAAGVTQQKLMNDFGSAGVTMWSNLGAKIDLNAAAAGHLAQAQDQDKSLIGAEDSIRGTFSNSADTLFTGLAEHKPLHSLLGSIGLNIGQSLIHSGVGTLTSGLFGESGQRGGGLLGGGLDGLLGGGGGGFQGWMPHFAAGTNDAPGGVSLVGEKGPELVSLAPHSQVTPNSALAALRAPAAAPNITFGDVHFHASGEGAFSDRQVAILAQQNEQAQQQMLDRVTRNLPQIQADSAQSS